MRMLQSVLVIFTLLILTACSDNSSKIDKTDDMPYIGQSIMLIVPTLHADLIRGPILKYSKVFEKESGATIRVVMPGWGDTIKNIEKSLHDENLHYDIFVVIAMWNGELLGNGHIEPIPQSIKDKIDWDDVLPIYKENILSWANVAYGLPYDGDCINLYYRKDIFEDEENRANFKKQYSYELAPPKTWKQYLEIASFFNGWDWDHDGVVEYGNAGLRIKGDVALLQFFAQAAAYAKHPDDKAYYFDPDTMRPRIDNPAFIRALEDYIKAMEYGPVGMNKFAGHDVRNSFVSSEVVMAIDWADLGIYAVNSPVSIVQDRVGYAQLPGAEQVYSSIKQDWEKRYNQVSSISGNWMFLINKDSKNKELAFDFAAYMSSTKMSKELVSTSGNAVNPSRFSHFKDPESWNKSGFSTDSARRYLDEISHSLTNKNTVFDITIPGAAEYYQVLDNLVYQAVIKTITPQEALKKAAIEWEVITDKLGREKQKEFYKSSLNLKR
ncbi:MAG: extracellular solute-binding protein [Campylobacterota bacterium]|nr:extracellular solute-binding protein [Campylobacterota bacterium]